MINEQKFSISLKYLYKLLIKKLLILFLRQFFNYKLQYQSEIERATQIPVLDEIVQVDSESPLVMKDGNRTLIAEQFRSLRTNLSYFPTAVPNKSRILVSSSVPGEGKSFISTNLAISAIWALLKLTFCSAA